jgi:hypothetical protein
MTTQTLDLNNIERKIFWTLASFIVGTLGFYLYSVASLTVAVVDRDHMNVAAHELANKTAEIERQYLAQANSITLAYAESIGFHEVGAKFTGATLIASNPTNGVKLSMSR